MIMRLAGRQSAGGHAIRRSASGTIPLTVAFTASVTGGGAIAAYKWDFDGDGAYDISTATNRVVHTTPVRDFIRLLSRSWMPGLSDSDSLDGHGDGRRCCVSGSAAGGRRDALGRAGFPAREYRARQSYAGGSLRIQARGPGVVDGLRRLHVRAASSFTTNWNVTALTDGTNYNLRARALDIDTNEVVSRCLRFGSTPAARRTLARSSRALSTASCRRSRRSARMRPRWSACPTERRCRSRGHGRFQHVCPGRADAGSTRTRRAGRTPGKARSTRTGVSWGDPALAKPIVIIFRTTTSTTTASWTARVFRK